jgi:hypothetical protein
VTACAALDRDLLRALEVPLQHDPGRRRIELSVFENSDDPARAADVARFAADVIEPPARPVEGDRVSLARHERVQRVAHPRAAAIVDEHVHRVLDVDLVAEDAAVAVVAVVLLVREIGHLEQLLLAQIEVERAARGHVAVEAALAAAREAERVRVPGRVVPALSRRLHERRHAGRPA